MVKKGGTTTIIIAVLIIGIIGAVLLYSGGSISGAATNDGECQNDHDCDSGKFCNDDKECEEIPQCDGTGPGENCGPPGSDCNDSDGQESVCGQDCRCVEVPANPQGPQTCGQLGFCQVNGNTCPQGQTCVPNGQISPAGELPCGTCQNPATCENVAGGSCKTRPECNKEGGTEVNPTDGLCQDPKKVCCVPTGATTTTTTVTATTETSSTATTVTTITT